MKITETRTIGTGEAQTRVELSWEFSVADVVGTNMIALVQEWWMQAREFEIGEKQE